MRGSKSPCGGNFAYPLGGTADPPRERFRPARGAVRSAGNAYAQAPARRRRDRGSGIRGVAGAARRRRCRPLGSCRRRGGRGPADGPRVAAAGCTPARAARGLCVHGARQHRPERRRRARGPAARPDARALLAGGGGRADTRAHAARPGTRRHVARRARGGGRAGGRPVPRPRARCSACWSGAVRGSPAIGCGCGASGWPSSSSAPCAPSARRSASAASRPPRSGRGSPATSTTPPAMRSTSSSSTPAPDGSRPNATPTAAREAFETIEEVARETVGEIDQLVGVLRDDPSSPGVEPPPGVAALDALVERHRAAGLEVTCTVRGDSRALPPSVDRGAYRILQEALTNAARHGDGSAQVEVTVGPTRSRPWSPIPSLGTGMPGATVAGAASSACASARRRSAAAWRRALATVASRYAPACPSSPTRHERAACPRADRRRRPPHARRPPRRVVERRADRGRRGGRGRTRRHLPHPAAESGRCPHGRPDAQPRRHLGYPRAARRLPRGEGRDPHHLRAGRLHLRCPQRGRLRVPAEANRPGGTARRHPHHRRRRLAPLAVGDQPRDRADGPPACTRRIGR